MKRTLNEDDIDCSEVTFDEKQIQEIIDVRNFVNQIFRKNSMGINNLIPLLKLIFGLHFNFFLILLLLRAYLLSWPGRSLTNMIFTFLPMPVIFLDTLIRLLQTSKLFKFLFEPIL